jgi:hypothetical protein
MTQGKTRSSKSHVHSYLSDSLVAFFEGHHRVRMRKQTDKPINQFDSKKILEASCTRPLVFVEPFLKLLDKTVWLDSPYSLRRLNTSVSNNNLLTLSLCMPLSPLLDVVWNSSVALSTID